jgi:hypothetical protein
MIESNLLKDFEWHRDKKGYRLLLSPPLKSLGMQGEFVIVSNGGPSVSYLPFARGGDLCRTFASVKSDRHLLRFVNCYGPLTDHFLPPPNKAMAYARKLFGGESVEGDLDNAKMFRELLRLKSQDTKKLASYFESDKPAHISFRNLIGRVELVGDPNKGVRLKICPPHLLGALWYQLGLKLNNATLRTCPVCDSVFEVGAGTDLRADAKFCCYEHKVEYFNRNRPRLTQSSERSRR